MSTKLRAAIHDLVELRTHPLRLLLVGEEFITLEAWSKKTGLDLDVIRLRMSAYLPAKTVVFVMPRARHISGSHNVGKSSKWRGVAWKEADNAWIARIAHDGKTYEVYHGKSEIDAAIHYNIAARLLKGGNAEYNVI